MPLPTPILDDRSYQQLRDELVRRIPVYNPEWTDHNETDPGVTLIELFAFLGESLLYRFNQIPETTRLAFLDLLDIPLRAAVPARALVEVASRVDSGVLVEQGAEARAGKTLFETEVEVTAWPVRAVAVARQRSAAPETDEGRAHVERTLDALELDEEPVAYYVNAYLPEDPAAPQAVAVDFGATVDQVLWVAVLADDGADPALADGTLNLGVELAPDVPAMAEVPGCPGAGASATQRSVAWQISTGALDGDTPRYAAVEVAGDTTNGLTRGGVVRLRLPRSATDFGDFPVVALSDPDVAGTGQLPPVLDDPAQAAAVLFWLRAFRPDGGALPALLYVGANVTEVVQTRTAAPEFLGTGDGQPDQSYALVNGDVVAGSLTLEVEGPDGWEPWVEVDDFEASAEDDPHYVLDAQAGTVRFGRVVQGRAPQIGERVRARRYRYGGGRAGNVAAGAITKVATHKANNPLPARGGADAEPVDAALARIPGELRRRDRAVTADDFRELALATPGADLGRAEVLPRFHPAYADRLEEAAGVVTVVVWPALDRRTPDAPRPDRRTLRLVCEWLDARRLVTTELYVVPPTYRDVAVSVGLVIKAGYGVDAVRRWVELVLHQYLAPLPPHGPDRGGWPLGRAVRGAELEAAVLQVEGVSHLDGDGLLLAGHASDGTLQTGLVELRRYEVPRLTTLMVVSGPPVPLTAQALSPPTPTDASGAPAAPIPIPTLREEC